MSLFRRMLGLLPPPPRMRTCEHCLEYQTPDLAALGDHEALCYQPGDPADFWNYPPDTPEEI